MKSYVIVRTTLTGYHHWPSAPEHRDYLANRHRHDFGIEMGFLVTHEDRQIEYHDGIDLLKGWWEAERGPASCETMARTCGEWMAHTTGLPVAWCEVNEDGQSGSRVEWDQ
jgi:hypothetical protein